jgi:hypothetical protein
MDQATVLRTAVATIYSAEAAISWSQLADRSDIDWSGVADIALATNLGPILYQAVNQVDSDAKLHDILERLRSSYFETASRNMLLVNNLTVLLQKLWGANIPVIVLKGGALAQTVYPDLALRPMVDLDLLLSFPDLEKAIEILETEGYGPIDLQPLADDSGLFWSEQSFARPGDQNHPVEIHWHLLDSPSYTSRFSTEDVIQRATTFSINNHEALMLCPEDQLLHLSAHYIYHHMGNLPAAQVDIGLIVERYKQEIEWDRLIDSASEMKLGYVVRKTLLESRQDWFGAISTDVKVKLEKLHASPGERLFAFSQRRKSTRVLRTAATLPGFGHRLAYLWGNLFPTREYMVWRYNLDPSISRPRAYLKRLLVGIERLIQELNPPKK